MTWLRLGQIHTAGSRSKLCPLVCSQMDQKQGRVYGFYKPFFEKVSGVRVESGPNFRLGQRDRNDSFHILQLARLGGEWKMVDVNTFSYWSLFFKVQCLKTEASALPQGLS